MDADGRIIPIVEGDQGEGFKDPIDASYGVGQLIAENEAQLLTTLEKGKTENEVLQFILESNQRIERLLNHIFDGHVLMNGRFTKL